MTVSHRDSDDAQPVRAPRDRTRKNERPEPMPREPLGHNHELVGWLIWNQSLLHQHLTQTRLRILLVHCAYANAQRESWPSTRTVSDVSGLDRQTVRRETAVLEQLGWLQKLGTAARPGQYGRPSTRYLVNLPGLPALPETAPMGASMGASMGAPMGAPQRPEHKHEHENPPLPTNTAGDRDRGAVLGDGDSSNGKELEQRTGDAVRIAVELDMQNAVGVQNPAGLRKYLKREYASKARDAVSEYCWAPPELVGQYLYEMRQYERNGGSYPRSTHDRLLAGMPPPDGVTLEQQQQNKQKLDAALGAPAPSTDLTDEQRQLGLAQLALLRQKRAG